MLLLGLDGETGREYYSMIINFAMGDEGSYAGKGGSMEIHCRQEQDCLAVEGFDA